MDSAFIYKNHHDIREVFGAEMRGGQSRRDSVFITTKLWSDHYGRKNARKFALQAIQELDPSANTDASEGRPLDLLLMHFSHTAYGTMLNTECAVNCDT